MTPRQYPGTFDEIIDIPFDGKGDKSIPQADDEPGELGDWDAGDDPGFIPPRQWLLANQFCLGFISSIVAAGGTGKSALRLLQYISLATGRALCGQHVFRRCRILLISLEDDRHELNRRIKAALDHHRVERRELKGWLRCSCPKLTKLAELKGKARAVGPLERQLRNAIAQHKPDLVALDPFVKTHALEESNSGDMDFVCDLLARLAVEFNIAVDSPHHVHKGTITPGDADAGRGSSGIRDAGRLVYTLTYMREEEAKLYGISVEDRQLYIRLDTAKVNLIRHSGKPTWFKLVGVSIGNATPDYPSGDTIQTVEPWKPPDLWTDLSPQTLNVVLDEIARGLANEQRYSAAASTKSDRAAWRVVQKYCATKTEGQCREIINAWVKSGLLITDDYDDPVFRKPVKGLHVDDAKRPG
jgi:AAA domain